jgi:hypothetical protein
MAHTHATPHVTEFHAYAALSSGEQKNEVADHIYARFRDKYPAVRAFMDEESLRPGNKASETMTNACTGANIGTPIQQ